MGFRRITVSAMAVAFVALVVYDIVAFIEPSDGDTISEVVQDWAFKHAGVPFGMGALMGHFLVPTATKRASWVKWAGFAVLLVSTAALLFVPSSAHPLAWFCAGLFLGRALWPLLRER